MPGQPRMPSKKPPCCSCDALVQGLGSLMETTGEAVVNEGVLEDLLEGRHDVHLGSGGRHGGGNISNTTPSAG
jgi:hypothetical protein